MLFKSLIASGLVLASASTTVLADRHGSYGRGGGGGYHNDNRGWDRGHGGSSFGLSLGIFNGGSAFGFGYHSGGYRSYGGAYYGGGYSYVPAPSYCPPPAVVYSAPVYSEPVYAPPVYYAPTYAAPVYAAPPVVIYQRPAVVVPYNSYYYGSPGYQTRSYYYYRR